MVKGKRNSITFTVKSNSADFLRVLTATLKKERYHNAAKIFTESSEGQTP